MIDERRVRKYCRDDISKIENYEEAISDKNHTWHLHHRLELTLDGEFALTPEQLKMHDMYYNRPYYELIFLTPAEHARLHSMNMSDETRRKISESLKGKQHSEERRKKISESLKGKQHSEERRKKISESLKGNQNMKGKHHSADTCKKISEANKGRHLSEEQRKKMSEAAKIREARKRESISHRESA